MQDKSIKNRWGNSSEIPEEIHETIHEKIAADSLQTLYCRLVDVFGEQILERVGEILDGERPIVSQTPARDWVNPNSGEVYASREIGTTGWHAFTHSSTKQKIEQIELLRAHLGFPPGSITATAVPRV